MKDQYFSQNRWGRTPPPPPLGFDPDIVYLGCQPDGDQVQSEIISEKFGSGIALKGLID
jgi:hypothetical protein